MTIFMVANHWTLSFAREIEAALLLIHLQGTRECICRVWHDNKKLFPFNFISVCVEFMVSKPYRAHPTWLDDLQCLVKSKCYTLFCKQFSFGSYVPFLRSRCYSHHPFHGIPNICFTIKVFYVWCIMKYKYLCWSGFVLSALSKADSCIQFLYSSICVTLSLATLLSLCGRSWHSMVNHSGQ
jgi:hypothetical protein